MLKVLSYDPLESPNVVQGFFTVHIPEWKMTIKDLAFCRKGESSWVNLPSLIKKDKEGKTQFIPAIQFDKEVQEKFLIACKKALQEFKGKV